MYRQLSSKSSPWYLLNVRTNRRADKLCKYTKLDRKLIPSHQLYHYQSFIKFDFPHLHIHPTALPQPTTFTPKGRSFRLRDVLARFLPSHRSALVQWLEPQGCGAPESQILSRVMTPLIPSKPTVPSFLGVISPIFGWFKTFIFSWVSGVQG